MHDNPDSQMAIRQMSTLPNGTEKHAIRVTRLTVLPTSAPLFSETATHIELRDEAAGEFVCLTQQNMDNTHTKSVFFDPEEWPVIRQAVDYMIEQCEDTQ